MRSVVSVLMQLRSRGKISSHAQSKPTWMRRDHVGSLKRYTPRQVNHARKPESLKPNSSATALCPPIEQSWPSTLKVKGRVGSPRITRMMLFAHCRPWRSANWPVGGEGWLSWALMMQAQSPTAQMLARPGRRMSGSVSSRPLSLGESMRSMIGAVVLPMVQTMVPPWTKLSPRPTPSPVARRTRTLSLMVTPVLAIFARANSRRFGLISGSNWSREWMSVTVKSSSLMLE